MIEIKKVDGELKISGDFDMGYAGKYTNDEIEILDSLDDIREWDSVCDNLDTDNCSDEEIVEFLTQYYNDFEMKVQANIKCVNDNFLLRVFSDMEACGNMFWDVKEWTVKEYLPDNEELEDFDPYESHYDELERLIEGNDETPNDGSVKKDDIEAILRKNYPVFNFNKLIKNIVPESLCLLDGQVSFQCSDNINQEILCSAYDVLDERLCFSDWHNF